MESLLWFLERVKWDKATRHPPSPQPALLSIHSQPSYAIDRSCCCAMVPVHACPSRSPSASAGESAAPSAHAHVSSRFTQRSLRFFGLFHCSIVYVESFARVKSLSMSGHIMYHLADKFVVQWEGLCARYPRAVYAGVLC